MTRSLDGVRVLVLRPEHQAPMLIERLRGVGAEPVAVPAIEISPPESWEQIDEAVGRMADYDWIVFTSLNGVEHFMSRVGIAEGFPERVGAIGPGTRDALVAGGVTVDWMPESFTSVALAEELPDPPARVLLVRADIATTDLEDQLRLRGFEVDRVDAYRTEPVNAELIRNALANVAAVALTSASIARSFASAAGADSGGPLVASIGPATSAACAGLGVRVDVEASEHTIAGLVTALGNLLARRAPPAGRADTPPQPRPSLPGEGH
ncbi:MAG: uroporphyrinogen-III synthase [Actinomycetota bacterium]